jgi:hypothetical protein
MYRLSTNTDKPLFSTFLDAYGFEHDNYVPVYLDPAVLAHEYAHLVIDAMVDFDREQYRQNAYLEPLDFEHCAPDSPPPTPQVSPYLLSLNLYHGFHEGIANYLAAQVFRTAKFGPYDLSQEAVYPREFNQTIRINPAKPSKEALDALPDGLNFEHAHGIVLARLLWSVQQEAGMSYDEAGQWTLSALANLREIVEASAGSDGSTASFSMSDVFAAFHQAAPGGAESIFCRKAATAYTEAISGDFAEYFQLPSGC